MPPTDVPREGQILTGPLFSEPMRVETVAAAGAGKTIVAGVPSRKLKLHRWAERVLVVTSANPAFQWYGSSVREQMGG